MSEESRSNRAHAFGSGSTRWRLLAAVILALATVGLAACGGDDDGGDEPSEAASSEDLGADLRDILGEPENLMALDEPLTLTVPASFALSGPGSVYGRLQSQGFEFGTEHVEAWTDGMLSLEMDPRDNRSGDPDAAVDNARRAALDGSPIFLTSYIFGFGAQAPIIEENEMFTLDAGGGTGPATIGQGLPYAYGYKAAFPVDMLGGLFRTFAELHPDVSTVAVLDSELGPDWTNATEPAVREAAQQEGMEVVHYETAELGREDVSPVISGIAEADADAVVFLTFGTDLGQHAREVQRQGIDAVLGATEFNPDAAELAGPAFEDWIFSIDFLDTQNLSNPWRELFVESWESDRDVAPENFNALYYAAAFAYAILADRIVGSGGDLQDGNAWVEALESDPAFPHVFGGSAGEVGEIVIDPESHTPRSITLISLRAHGTGSTQDFDPLAQFDIGGRDFELLAED